MLDLSSAGLGSTGCRAAQSDNTLTDSASNRPSDGAGRPSGLRLGASGHTGHGLLDCFAVKPRPVAVGLQRLLHKTAARGPVHRADHAPARACARPRPTRGAHPPRACCAAWADAFGVPAATCPTLRPLVDTGVRAVTIARLAKNRAPPMLDRAKDCRRGYAVRHAQLSSRARRRLR